MSDAPIVLEDPDILKAEVCEDQDGDFGLFICPIGGVELCITESEMLMALAKIAEMKGEG